MNSFVRTCQAFGVPFENVRILATEATRTAPNGEEFRNKVKTATNLTVELLSEDDEGRIGALGIVSSFPAPINGVVLDLGGGSVQISWVRIDVGGDLQRSESAVSMPFGAAAMMGRLDSGTKSQDLASEIVHSFRQALEDLMIPKDMLGEDGEGLTLYLSGGGFRGWGYALMDRHPIQPYPIPIINGFSTDAKQFNPRVVLSQGSGPVTDEIFRISERRASQSPAVTLLITSLLTILPRVSTINFAQGGVREGSLFSILPTSIQTQHPLIVATIPYATTERNSLTNIIECAIPQSNNKNNNLPLLLTLPSSRSALVIALASLITYHNSCPKDIKPSAALRSTTTGILASTHSLTHEIRAWLALALLARWGGTREDLPKTDIPFYDGLTALIGPESAWWAGYIGRAAGVVGALFPAGTGIKNVSWNWDAKWSEMGGKKGGAGVVVISVDWAGDDEDVRKALRLLRKWGKKKKWEARGVRGCKIEIEIEGLEEEDDVSD